MSEKAHFRRRRRTTMGCCKSKSCIVEPLTYRAFGTEQDKTSDESRNRYLVFVNPNSGPGKSVQVFQQLLEPRLMAAGIKYELVITERTNHARAMIRTRNLDEFSAIIILSGDGLVFEVVNGIIERADREKMLRKPIGIVPSGSGNALIAAVFEHCKIPVQMKTFIERACEIVVSPRPSLLAVNLFHVETPTEHMCGFLSVGWALMSDIDIESEKWRRTLGGARFTAGAVVRCFNLRTYRGRLSYLPLEENMALTSAAGNNASTSSLEQIDQPTISDEAPKEDEDWDSVWRRRYPKTAAAKDFPRLNESVPTSWTVLVDDFVLVYAVTISHLGANGPYMPCARLDDDRIYLTYVTKRQLSNRLTMLRCLADIEHAKHLNYSFFKVVPVHALRIEPIDKGSCLTVDGEVVKCDSIQMTNSVYKARIMGEQG